MKRLLAILISICMLISVFPTHVFAIGEEQKSNEVLSNQDWTGYTAISTKEELNGIRNNLDGNYYLTSNIEFSEDDFAEGGMFYNEGAGWLPIGDDFFNAFTGIFDGNGYYVSGLQIRNSESSLSGLFGCCKGTIRNLGVINANISTERTSSNALSGAVTGLLNNGTIINCYSSGSVSASFIGKDYNSMAGGIVGQAYNGSVINCSNEAEVTALGNGATQNAGGVVGYAASGNSIEACYNTGKVLAQGYYGFAGGIVAYANETTISLSYNTGNVSALCNETDKAANAGGIASSLVGNLSNCYNTGDIKVNGVEYAFAGGIVCSLYGTVDCTYNVGNVVVNETEWPAIMGAVVGEIHTGEVTNSYYLDNISNGIGEGNSTAVQCSKEQLYNVDTYEGFDFDTVWEFEEGSACKYPTLIVHQTVVVDEDAVFNAGDGTEESPYYIASARQLNNIRDNLSAHYKLACDIEFTQDDFNDNGLFYNEGSGWLAIGDSAAPFVGSFDGNNFSITGLQANITGTGDVYAGLFGYCKGTVSNLNLVNANISGTITGTENSVWVGGVCGYLSSGAIENCSVSGSISAYETCVESQDKSKAYAGGIAGQSDNGSFTSCSNFAEVTALADSRASSSGGGSWATFAYAGGIVSKTTGTISKSFNVGRINAQAHGNYAQANASGVTASSNNNISMCYNTGMVRAMGNPNNGAAGIVASYSKGTISNCYNTGYITGDGNVAGIVEYLSSGNVSNVYNVGEISGKTSYYVRAIIADVYSGTVKNCYYTNTSISGIRGITDTSVRLSLDNAQNKSSYVGFDFDNVWSMCNLQTHPFPELNTPQHTTVPQLENTTEFAGGTGSYFNPYKIETKEHLNNVRNYLGANFVLMNDIVFTSEDFAENGEFYNDGAGWNPIGTEYTQFSGTFDGNNNTISGLYVNIVLERGEAAAGLFGYSSGSISDLGMVDSNINVRITTTSTNYVCMPYAGGIVGYNKGFIERCFNIGKVYAFCQPSQVHAGGIAGRSLGYIGNCINAGDVLAETCGSSYSAYAGGIVGDVGYSSSIGKEYCLENCYNIGNVSTKGGHSALAGIAPNCQAARMKGCYYLDNLSDSTSAVKCTEEQMKLATTFAEYDFDSVWTMEGNSEYVYPELIGNEMPLILNSIEISSLPNKLTYLEEKDALNVSGGKLSLCYNNNYSEEIDITSDMVSGFNNKLVGEQVLTVTYKGKTCTYTIEIIGKSLDGIAIATEPTKLVYLEGKDELDTSEGKITLYYNNDTSEEIGITADMISGFNNKVVGEQTLIVTYNGKTCSYNVEVIAKTLERIEVTQLPDKLSYLEVKDSLDVSGGVITLYYDNDTSEEISITEDMVSGFNNTIIGAQVLTVTYMGKTSTYQVNIAEKKLQYVSVSKLPTKTTFYKNIDKLDISGGRLLLHYNNDTTDEISLSLDMISGFNNLKVGKQLLTVSYLGKTTAFYVNVVEQEINDLSSTITLTNATTVAGRRVKLDVLLNNNPGVASLTLRVGFDSNALSLVEVTDEGMLGTQVHSDQYTSPYVLNWVNDTITDDITYNGKIVTLVFEVSDNAEIGSYDITLSYDYHQYDIYNSNVQKVNFITIDGEINVTDVILGDVNSDGEINNLDRFVLTRFLGNWSGYDEESINLNASDLNQDGDVNNLDRLILTRYLADWSGYETLPVTN